MTQRRGAIAVLTMGSMWTTTVTFQMIAHWSTMEIAVADRHARLAAAAKRVAVDPRGRGPARPSLLARLFRRARQSADSRTGRRAARHRRTGMLAHARSSLTA